MTSTVSFGDRNCGVQARTVNGSVSTTIHLPPERPETPPPPSIVIPFPRDSDYVERGTILDHVDQTFAAPGARAALVGLGGVGKSQLAIEYAYRMCERPSESWVFWVHASNAARFEQSFRDIADRVKIAGRRDVQANIFKLVHDWFYDCKQRWLLVLDNVDDARFLLDARANTGGGRPLREYLPHCERGSILVTTRSREAALKLVEQRNIFIVKPMNKKEGVTLFEKKLGVLEDSSSDIAKLAAALEHMPLAIVQAAAYISQRAPRYSVRRYLDDFEKSERKRTGLLNYDEAHLRRDWEAKNSIIVTWEISFAYIQQTQQSAADLLSLMSFFDRQGIPEGLLQRRARPGHVKAAQEEEEEESDDTVSDSEDITSQSSLDDNEFEEDVTVLRNFCFISTDPNGTMFKMHALVQLAMRKWLEANNKLEQWKQQFVSNLSASFPTGEYKNWAQCRALYAHAKAAAGQRPENDSSVLEWATLLYYAAWFAERIGNIADAEMLATKAMKARKKILGEEDKDTLASIMMVGLAYKLGGRWLDAETLFMQVMEIYKTNLGTDHPHTLISMGNLALTYYHQCRWDDAEALEMQIMKIRKNKFGADHPHTLVSMGNLALTYYEQCRWDDAEALEVQVMETRKSKLGADHLHTLTSMGNLALIYKEQGRVDEAEALELQVMENRKTKLGADHPDTLKSMSNLASTYDKQGRLDDAEALEMQVMENRKTKLGADHPHTLMSMANLASTYKKQGRLDDSEALEVQVMNARKNKLGADHPHTLISMANLAWIYWEQDRLDDAEALEVQVMNARKNKLGADHPDTLESMHNLAITWKEQGRTADAIDLMSQCLQQRQRVLKANHPDIQISLQALEEWEAEKSV